MGKREGEAASEDAVGESVTSSTNGSKAQHRLTRMLITIGKKSSKQERRKLNTAQLHIICNSASIDFESTVKGLIELADGLPPAVHCELARLCLDGRLGRVGERHTMRKVAAEVLQYTLSKAPLYAPALCLRGESLLPPEHGGLGAPDAPAHALEEAYCLFSRAAALGDSEALFLQGRFQVTTAPSHGNVELADDGLKRVLRAAERGVARAYIFAAICHEFPTKYAPIPSLVRCKKRARTILDLYTRAAELGDAAALNDVGTSIAMGYSDLRPDFDEASRHYASAIRGGYVEGFENIGKHYETGMDGAADVRIDYLKALLYYKQGTRLRSANCARHLARWYNEGVVVEEDMEKAVELYSVGLWIANDEHNYITCSEILKELSALYVCLLKMNTMVSEKARAARDTLQRYLGAKSVASILADVDEAVFKALMGRRKKLNSLLGGHNCKRLLKYCKNTLNSTLGENPASCDELEHVFGRRTKQLRENWKRTARYRKQK